MRNVSWSCPEAGEWTSWLHKLFSRIIFIISEFSDCNKWLMHSCITINVSQKQINCITQKKVMSINKLISPTVIVLQGGCFFFFFCFYMSKGISSRLAITSDSQLSQGAGGRIELTLLSCSALSRKYLWFSDWINAGSSRPPRLSEFRWGDFL